MAPADLREHLVRCIFEELADFHRVVAAFLVVARVLLLVARAGRLAAAHGGATRRRRHFTAAPAPDFIHSTDRAVRGAAAWRRNSSSWPISTAARSEGRGPSAPRRTALVAWARIATELGLSEPLQRCMACAASTRGSADQNCAQRWQELKSALIARGAPPKAVAEAALAAPRWSTCRAVARGAALAARGAGGGRRRAAPRSGVCRSRLRRIGRREGSRRAARLRPPAARRRLWRSARCARPLARWSRSTRRRNAASAPRCCRRAPPTWRRSRTSRSRARRSRTRARRRRVNPNCALLHLQRGALGMRTRAARAEELVSAFEGALRVRPASAAALQHVTTALQWAGAASRGGRRRAPRRCPRPVGESVAAARETRRRPHRQAVVGAVGGGANAVRAGCARTTPRSRRSWRRCATARVAARRRTRGSTTRGTDRGACAT